MASDATATAERVRRDERMMLLGSEGRAF
jgi:hypothetical protein